jgi:hypothetical protein
LDDFNKISIGCAVAFAAAIILIVGFAAAQPVTQNTFTPPGNFVTQNTVHYGNSTTYMLEWNGSAGSIQAIAGGAGGTTIYSGNVSNGTQITLVVANGESATVYFNYESVAKIPP